MSIRFLTVAAILLIVASATVRAFDDLDAEAGARTITIIKPVNSGNLFPLKNPGVVTLGTLSILNRIDFAISAVTTNGNANAGPGGALTFSWNWGDGTPNGSGAFPNHTYVVPGNYSVTVTTTEAGNVTPTVNVLGVTVTDAVKSIKLLTNEMFSNPGNDSIYLRGVLRIPSGINLQAQQCLVNIGGSADGVTFIFNLVSKGTTTVTTNLNAVFNPVAQTLSTTSSNCSAKLKLLTHAPMKGADFVDTPFNFTAKGSFNAALAAELPNPNKTNLLPVRDNVRLTVKITFPSFPIVVNSLVPPLTTGAGILYQTGVNQVYSATKMKGMSR